RNTPAGIIKFESKAPSQEFDSYVSGSYGSLGTAGIEGAIGGGLTDTLSARFSFLFQTQDDWVDNDFTGESDALGGYDNLAYRLQFLWNPQPRFNALFNVHGWDLDGTARIFRANMITPGDDDVVSGFDRDVVFHDGLNDQDIETRGGLVKLDYAFDTGNLTSVTGYETVEMFSRGDIDGGFGASFAPPFGPGFIPFFAESSDGIPDLDQFTQEIRWASNLPGDFQWLAGAFYFDESLEAETFSYVSIAPGNPVEGFANQNQDAESWALFGSVDRKFGDAWAVKAGLRFTHDEKDFSAERPIPLFFNTPTVRPVTASTDDDFVNWDLSATYALRPTMNLYGRLATGSRAPSIQGRILFAPDGSGGTDPATDGLSVAGTEDLVSAEVGVKSQFPNRNLRLNGTIYMYEVDGQQVTAVGGEFNTATILNADKTDGYGFETDLQWAPSAPWMVTIGLSYNHTEIDDPNLTVAPCGGGCTVIDPIVNGLALVHGNTLPHAPEWIVNGIVDYRSPFGEGAIVGAFDWAYSSEKQVFLYESEEFESSGLELGLRFGYMWADGTYEAAVFGRNLTDELIVQNGIDFNNLTGMVNEPRIVGVELVTRF
ncbi:MAG: TonB-dependent receptor, partial [Acidobacteria bacterium]|nr:TonB-dependent receptor [Acidobacteriota bacterium]